MRFTRSARLDTSQISDQRGRRGGGGKIALGGAGGLLALVLALLLGGGVPGGSGSVEDVVGGLAGSGAGGAPEEDLAQQCRTVADVDEIPECRYVVYQNSIQGYWRGVFEAAGQQYPPAGTTFFTGGVQTGCGAASSAVGPFYCPPDERVYLDLGFFDELTTKFGAQGGDFAEAYVLAHEYGHHISNVTGTMAQVQQREEGPQSDSVRLELQADCYAGLWARNAERTPGPDGQPLIQDLDRQDIVEGLDAARVVGDDYIQSRFQGTVSPETWTHGSSEQRQKWFLVGYEKGSFGACDTFAVPRV
jgi:predicted metalloprotease